MYIFVIFVKSQVGIATVWVYTWVFSTITLIYVLCFGAYLMVFLLL